MLSLFSYFLILFFLFFFFNVNHFLCIHNFLSFISFFHLVFCRVYAPCMCLRLSRALSRKFLIYFSFKHFYFGFVTIFYNLAFIYLNAIDIDSLFHQVTLQTKWTLLMWTSEFYTKKKKILASSWDCFY